MFKITFNFVRYTKKNLTLQGYLRLNNFVSIPATQTAQNVESEEATEIKRKHGFTYTSTDKPRQNLKQHSLIAAAFSLLKHDNVLNEIKTPYTDSRIANATTTNELLSIADGTGVSRRLALKIISVLSDWTTSGKIDMQEFEYDSRFIRLCKVLTKGLSSSKVNRPNTGLPNGDLMTVLGMTAEEDTAKLMSSMSLSHMVKVLSFLALKHNRSTTLLRTLAFSISGKAEHLTLKQCADVLYSAAVLNFIDENLIDKACRDIFSTLEQYDLKSSVVSSILTSLGLLRFKNSEILDALSNWILKHQTNCRPHDIFSLFITLGILNHQPANAEELYKVLLPQLNPSDAKKASLWLDIVWSLIVLNQATPEHISTVLSKDFVAKSIGDGKYINGTRLKLWNINSACDLLIDNYTGPRLSDDLDVKAAVLTRSRDKEKIVNLMLDSLSSLFNPTTHMTANIDTKMGFYIDAQIALDNKHNPLPLDHTDSIRVAVLAYDYHDMCHGRVEPTGIAALNAQLLEAQGYKILKIPYTEFNASDKFINRVKYLESRIKALPLN